MKELATRIETETPNLNGAYSRDDLLPRLSAIDSDIARIVSAEMARLDLERNQTPEPPKPFFEPLTYADIIKRPQKVWLIQDIIGPGDLGQVFGEEGTGKTFVILDLIFAAIQGLKWCQKFEIARPLTVAYCTAEGRAGIPQRFKAAGEWYQVDKHPDSLQNLSIFLDVPQLFDQQAEAYITQFVSDYTSQCGDHLDLLIIDTLHTATVGSNENDTRDAGKVINATKMARDELGCAVLFAHHANRANASYRGSSAYAAAMDVMLECTSKKNPRKLNCQKSKDAERFDPLEFLLEAEGDLVHVYWNGPASEKDTNRADELLAEMQAQADVYLAAKAWGEALNVSQHQAIALLKKLVDSGEIKRKLKNADKKNSPSNPWLYGYEDAF